VVETVEADIQEMEHEVFAPTRSNPAERIYTLEREVLDLHRAIAAVPTGVAAIDGMNFSFMPELQWHRGYPVVLTSIVLLCALYWRFRRSGWL
jgi:Mg2+ and Co2+ transporter CorA